MYFILVISYISIILTTVPLFTAYNMHFIRKLRIISQSANPFENEGISEMHIGKSYLLVILQYSLVLHHNWKSFNYSRLIISSLYLVNSYPQFLITRNSELCSLVQPNVITKMKHNSISKNMQNNVV